MKVVGHVDQLRQSRCYQSSEKLTCITCHNPHGAAEPEKKRARSVQACSSCHTDESCGLERAERLQKNAANDCVACHMPTVDTDIPHIAFTHHRIGVHAKDSPAPETRPNQLVDLRLLEPLPNRSELERDRNLGLAYFGLAQTQADPAAVDGYRQRARSLLLSVRSRGMSDGEVSAALARIAFSQQDSAAALSLAGEALQSPGLSPKSRINSLFYVGLIGAQANRLELALPALEKLTASRRLAEDWFWLGMCRERSGDLAEALRDLKQAAAIAPFRADIHNDLGQFYQRLGNTADAERERATAQRLSAGQR
jgi:predicted CXXCH cytochrome family protein